MLGFFLLIFIFAPLTTGWSLVENCGVRSVIKPKDRDEYKAFAGEFPWMVSIRAKKGYDFTHVCGGSVLNENWIITAATCLRYWREPARYEILVGLLKQSETDAPSVQKLKISEIFFYEKFKHRRLYDIALVKTDTPIDIAGSNGYVNGICLPDTRDDPINDGLLIGWSTDFVGSEYSDDLMKMKSILVDRKKCNLHHNANNVYSSVEVIKETMICTAKTTYGPDPPWHDDPCVRDSGSPLFQLDSAGVATLIGILSFASLPYEEQYSCYRSYPPDSYVYSPVEVYTKVAAYKDWIAAVVTQN
nr:venom protein [Lampona murina]